MLNCKKHNASFVRYMAVLLICLIMLGNMSITGYTEVAEKYSGLDYRVAAENSALKLQYSSEKGAVIVTDKRNGYIWDTIVSEEKYDMSKTNKTWEAYMTSPIVISYLDMGKKGNSIRKAYSSIDSEIGGIQVTKDGLEIEFHFTKLGINVVIEYRLNEESLSVYIPSEKIEETTKYAIKTIELMPFFGASNHLTDGYIMYPDGSGALVRYENTLERPQIVNPYILDIYSPLTVNLDRYAEREYNNIYTASLPVYGIKNGQNAVLCAIVEDEYNASIKISTQGQSVDLNRVNFDFTYRYDYTMDLSNISIEGTGITSRPSPTYVDQEIIQQSPQVDIFFLYDDDADYSGMASVYRDYLIESNSIHQAIKKDDNIPLGLDLFMGIKEERVIFSKFITTTTFKDAINMSQQLMENGVDNMQIMLNGWTKGGYGLNSVPWPPERRLGGSSGLKKLSEIVDENGLLLYLRNDFISANKKTKDFSKRNDSVLQGSKLLVTDSGKSNFLMNAMVSFKKFNGVLKNLEGYKGINMAFDAIGTYIYHDYNRSNPFSREGTANKWQEIVDSATTQQKLVAVKTGNAYLLKDANRLYGIPLEDSRNLMTDETIPFYQMVVHGIIPYSSDPGNLSYDYQYTKLKWIEYGCMPYFELTYKNSENLKDTNYNILFTSNYDDWFETIVDTYKEFNQRLQSIWSQKMINHEKIGEKLYCVEYSNGTMIYVNYDTREVIHDGLTVDAQDYLVVEKGGVLR